MKGALGFNFEDGVWLGSCMSTCFYLQLLRVFPFIHSRSIPRCRLSALLLVAMAETEGRACPPGVPGIQPKREECHLHEVCPASLTVSHGVGKRLCHPGFPVTHKELSSVFLKCALSSPWHLNQAFIISNWSPCFHSHPIKLALLPATRMMYLKLQSVQVLSLLSSHLASHLSTGNIFTSSNPKRFLSQPCVLFTECPFLSLG